MKRNASRTIWAVAAFAIASGTGTNAVRAQENTAANTPTASTPTATPKKATRAKKVRTYEASGATTAAGTATKEVTRVKGTSYTRVIHAIAGGPSVDVYVDGKKMLSNVAYKSVSEYLAIPTGKHNLKVTKSGETTALLTSDLTHVKDKFYTVAAYGTPEKPLLLRVNEATGKEVEGKARVYVVHLAQTSAIDVTTPSARNKTTGFASFLKAIPAGTARAKTVVPGDVKLQIRADGKVITEASAKVEAGKRYTVFAVGNANALDLIVKPSADKPIVTP